MKSSKQNNHRPKPTPLATIVALSFLFGSTLLISACNDSTVDPVAAQTAALRNNVKNIVVIYAENRSFDGLYGNFPGANGLSTVLDAQGNPTSAYIAQKDRNGYPLTTLPPTWGGVTAGGITPVVTQAQSTGLANKPFPVETSFQSSANATLSTSTVTRDLVHRFFQNQMQIDGGKNDMFAAWTDAGGLTMGYFNTQNSALYKLAQNNVFCDNFFQGAFGGSFLTHQYLISASAPEYPNADTAAAKPSIAILDKDPTGKYLPQLSTTSASPGSALDGPPIFVVDGNVTPANYFGDNKFYCVNTMQPAYQPSGNAPVDTKGNDAFYANPAAATTVPPQTKTTIGDLLEAKNVNWKWYSGSWDAATADGKQDPSVKRSVIYTGNQYRVATTTSVDFQAHHQPFNYFAKFDPVTNAAYRTAHLQDYNNLLADAKAGTLPPVTFYKPEGVYNEHQGYANIDDGDAKIAQTIAALQASPQWNNMVIVVTYDENGGSWDHVAPPKADLLGPGSRVPAMIISPFAKKGTVDHTQYDTASVLRLITRTFGLDTLPGLTARDNALVANGGKPMGDLTAALNLQ